MLILYIVILQKKLKVFIGNIFIDIRHPAALEYAKVGSFKLGVKINVIIIIPKPTCDGMYTHI